ncbi:MAG TPA: methyltransferase regulatory domain-containing protein [Scandinavium sp.]|jgi:predicted O-linked N-acetylglucosamine transferase (SPINDLY family)/precorrin-6B methylase 2|uniref:O-linked N-acetylglucosamine transferase family protein n=1 Tax=Scandinavium sp. TaxID=2830653 RepID=UPI002E312DE9|nr:methyltransferase regulatory domain-containing protein [Scandinavium sp.]HEX4500788.1 methyltransferase regulatory domain-containing protein [Scandinavium sp.]
MNAHDYFASGKPESSWTPSKLQTAAALYGHQSPAIKYARILVLGCAGGETLLALAASLPFARVVGIELISEAFEQTQQQVLAVGTGNLELYSLTVQQVLDMQDNDWDYVIIQNSFALLNRQLNSMLLQRLQSLLSPAGVLAIEWECLPGSASLETLREAMQMASGSATSLEMQIAKAKLMLATLVVMPGKPEIQQEQVKSERISDELFAHRYLESSRESEYLVELNARLDECGLCYVGDAQPFSESPETGSHHTESLLAAMGVAPDKILIQQHIDFLVNRARRFSLLTHEKNRRTVKMLPERRSLKNLRFAGAFRRSASHERNIASSLASNDGLNIATTDKVTLAILDILGEAWPRSVSFEQLLFHCEIIGEGEAKDAHAAVENALWSLLLKNIPGLHYLKGPDSYSNDGDVDLHIIDQVDAQLKFNPKADWLINGWGEVVSIDDAERALLLGPLNVDAEHWQAMDSLCFKGLVNAGGVGWKHFLQKMILCCPQDAIFRITSALFLYSCDEGAYGFMAKEYKALDKLKNVAEFVQDDVALTHEQQNIISQHMQRGEYNKGFEQASKFLEDNIQTGAKEYYLFTLARSIGDHKTALAKLSLALSFHSTSLFLYSEMAFAFLSCKCHWQAWRLANAILRCNQKSSPEWYLLASIHFEFKEYEKSEYCARKAFDIAPDSRLIATLLGGILCEQTRTDEGIALLRRAIKNKETDFRLLTGLGFAITHSPKATLQEIQQVHLDYGHALANWAKTQHFSGYIEKDKDPQRKLRIGFVSGDFRDSHPVSFFFSPIWHALDRNKCELIAYSNIPAHYENDGTARFRDTADLWRNVCHVSDIEMAEMIKQDAVDILVDLSGYTSDNRLPVFALKPAPVQISWVGYHATTGLSAMDYYATIFPVNKSVELEQQFTEKLIYLYLPRNFDQASDKVKVNKLPAMENKHFTFGSFNRTNKLNPQVFTAWTDILHAVPDSRMIVGNMPKVVWADISRQFTSRGISEDRFELRELAGMDTYLSYHNDVDLLLDTFPFTGGTVTSHAAWMGVPTVSFAGDTLVSRQGASIMYSLGLPQFVAENIDDFVKIAAGWADKRDELNDIRLGLRERMNIQGHTQQQIGEIVESMFRRCWELYCNNKSPESFSIGQMPTF